MTDEPEALRRSVAEAIQKEAGTAVRFDPRLYERPADAAIAVVLRWAAEKASLEEQHGKFGQALYQYGAPRREQEARIATARCIRDAILAGIPPAPQNP